MLTLFIRAPFEAGAGSTTPPFTVTEDPSAVGRMTVTIDATDPARLNLLPVFPGKLTFKPTRPLTNDTPAVGNLYLELAPAAVGELGALLTDLHYSFLFIYHDVSLTDAFWVGTVKNAPIADSQAGTLRETFEQKQDAFKRGLLSVNIVSSKATAGCVLPAVQKNATNQGVITLELGVRTIDDLVGSATTLSLTAMQLAQIVDPARYLPVPIAFFYRALRGMSDTRWTAASATGHKAHPFYDAMDRLDAAVLPARPPRWRRLRVFVSRESTIPGSLSEALADTTVRAMSGATTLWERRLNVLGELFVRRADGEAFNLEVMQAPAPTFPPPATPPATPPPPLQRKLAPHPTGTLATSLARTWAPPPSAAAQPPKLDIRVELDFDGDPLVDPMPGLEERMLDADGLTVVMAGKKPERIVARRHMVVPLQKRLASLGFGSTKTPSPLFTVPVRHAVREFQREARMTELNGAPMRVIGGQPVAAASITPFAGAINGKADRATLEEMRQWVRNGYRAAASFKISRSGTTVADVGYADATTVGWDVDVLPARRFGAFTRLEDKRAKKFHFGLTKSLAAGNVDNNREPKTELTDPARAASYAYLKTWEKRVILAVVRNESKIFEAINTYDTAFLTAGAIQWTAGTEEGAGELPGVLSTLPAADFQRLFGVWGLGTTGVTGTAFVDVVRGFFTLDGSKVKTVDQKEELRGVRWGYRFAEAARDNVWREIQIRNAHGRIGTMLRRTVRWGSSTITVESLLQSELLRALSLDEHVNAGEGRADHDRPTGVQRTHERLARALQKPSIIISTTPEGTFAGEWFTEFRKLMLKFTNLDANSLSPEEIADFDLSLFPMIGVLVSLRYRCEDPAADLRDLEDVLGALGLPVPNREHTAGLTVTGGTLQTMTQEQHSLAFELAFWLRQNLSGMHAPEDRWNVIVGGGYTGSLGRLSTTPGVFTP